MQGLVPALDGKASHTLDLFFCRYELATQGWQDDFAKGPWCSGPTSASQAEGPRFKSQRVHSSGLLRELNPGPLAPEARIMPLDQAANGKKRIFCSIP